MDTPARESEVIQQINLLEKRINALDEVSTVIEQRLTSYLRPEGPRGNPFDEKMGKEAVLTPVGIRLSKISDQLNAANNRIQSILNRLEA